MLRPSWLALLAVLALGCGEPTVSGSCETYAATSDSFYAEQCPDGRRYELVCTRAERADGSGLLDCACARNGRYGVRFTRDRSLPSEVPEAIETLNEACDWNVPRP